MKKNIFASWKLIFTVFAIMVASICIFVKPTLAGDGPVITTQPQDIFVNFPEGGTFTVEVENPKDVSYQWILVDGIGQEFALEGTSATTDTLILPSTDASFDGCKVYCVVIDKVGKYTCSDLAQINILNPLDKIPVLYVESYALLPGQSIDLKTVNLGSGTISFNNDGKKIVLDNVNFDNEEVVFDTALSPAVGLMYRGYDDSIETMTLELKGKNKFLNRFYQELTNGSGIPIDFYSIGTASKTPFELLITGNGSLTLQGGTYLIRNNGKITVDADLTLLQYENHFCDGINAESSSVDATVTICPGAKLTADLNGTGIFSSTAINIQKGSKVDIHSSAPVVYGGTQKRVLYAKDISIDNADVNIDMEMDLEQFKPEGGTIDMFNAITAANDGSIKITDSNLNISIKGGTKEDVGYIFNNGAIITNKGNLLIKNSNVDINMDCQGSLDAEGMRIGGATDIENSTVKININALQMVHGLYCDKAINLKNSIMDVFVDARDFYMYDEEIKGAAHGIISNKGINISLKDGQYIKAVSKKGISLGVDYELKQKTPAGFDEFYKPQYIKINDDCEIVLPKNAILNRTSRLSGTKYIYTETPYNLNNKTAIEDTTLIQKRRLFQKLQIVMK